MVFIIWGISKTPLKVYILSQIQELSGDEVSEKNIPSTQLPTDKR